MNLAYIEKNMPICTHLLLSKLSKYKAGAFLYPTLLVVVSSKNASLILFLIRSLDTTSNKKCVWWNFQPF